MDKITKLTLDELMRRKEQMLEAKKEPTPDIYRIGINASDGAAFYVYFNHSRKSVVKSLSNTYQFYIWKSKK